MILSGLRRHGGTEAFAMACAFSGMTASSGQEFGTRVEKIGLNWN
jgi:hypothetical protein